LEKINDVGIKEIVTAYRSPWQKGYVERVIGTISVKPAMEMDF